MNDTNHLIILAYVVFFLPHVFVFALRINLSCQSGAFEPKPSYSIMDYTGRVSITKALS